MQPNSESEAKPHRPTVLLDYVLFCMLSNTQFISQILVKGTETSRFRCVVEVNNITHPVETENRIYAKPIFMLRNSRERVCDENVCGMLLVIKKKQKNSFSYGRKLFIKVFSYYSL